MKYIVLVGDGMADYPLKELGGLTPLEKAKKTNLDFLAKNGILGMVKTTPRGMTPGTDIANLSILGYDPGKYYAGRGPLEAMNSGINIGRGDIVFRCNLVQVKNGKLIDYSAGHIETAQAKILIKTLNKKLGNRFIRFYPGVNYRHLLVIKTRSRKKICQLLSVKCFPPHDVMGRPLKEILPKGNGAEILLQLMEDSLRVLKSQKANMVWLWGQGEKPRMPAFFKKYRLKGAVISAVDIVKGIGKAIGLRVINVPGATGYFDTNYKGKAEYALNAMKKLDFVFIHVETPDEAGHIGDVKAKIKAIEDFDKKVVGTILKGIERYSDYRILALTDHPTPISLRTHTADPVPFIIYGKGGASTFFKSDSSITKGDTNFDEKCASKSRLFFKEGHKLMKFFLGVSEF